MKRPLPTSIPSIPPAAVLAEAKKKKLVYVGTGDEKKDMFDPPVEGYRWAEGQSLKFDSGMLGFCKDFHFFIPRKTAAKYFVLPKAPVTKFVLFRAQDGRGVPFCDNAYLKLVGDEGFQVDFDGKETPYEASTIREWVKDKVWTFVTKAEALAQVKKPAAPKKKTPLELLTAENTALKTRVAKLEAAIRAANKAL